MFDSNGHIINSDLYPLTLSSLEEYDEKNNQNDRYPVFDRVKLALASYYRIIFHRLDCHHQLYHPLLFSIKESTEILCLV